MNEEHLECGGACKGAHTHTPASPVRERERKREREREGEREGEREKERERRER